MAKDVVGDEEVPTIAELAKQDYLTIVDSITGTRKFAPGDDPEKPNSFTGEPYSLTEALEIAQQQIEFKYSNQNKEESGFNPLMYAQDEFGDMPNSAGIGARYMDPESGFTAQGSIRGSKNPYTKENKINAYELMLQKQLSDSASIGGGYTRNPIDNVKDQETQYLNFIKKFDKGDVSGNVSQTTGGGREKVSRQAGIRGSYNFNPNFNVDADISRMYGPGIEDETRANIKATYGFANGGTVNMRAGIGDLFRLNS